MNFHDPIPSGFDKFEPFFNKDAIYLNSILRNLDKESLKNSMKLSDNLLPHVENIIDNFTGKYQQGRQAVFAYRGAVFKAMNSINFNNNQVIFTQKNLRILSGQYGVLKPLDCIEEYRLDMKTALKTKYSSNMYEYWTQSITNYFKIFNKNKIIINLASNEYSKIIKFSEIKSTIINFSFGEITNNEIKYPPMYSKIARGKMTGYILRNFLTETDQIKNFDTDNYKFNSRLSNKNHYIFTR